MTILDQGLVVTPILADANGGISANTALGAVVGLLTVAAAVISLLWKLDRTQLVERVREAMEEAEKNLARYDQATKRYDAAVAELAAVKADLARLQGRLEGVHSSTLPPLPLPSFPRKPT